MYGLSIAYLHLPLTYCKAQGQCHAHFRLIILEMKMDMVKITFAIKIASHAWPFDWHIYI